MTVGKTLKVHRKHGISSAAMRGSTGRLTSPSSHSTAAIRSCSLLSLRTTHSRRAGRCSSRLGSLRQWLQESSSTHRFGANCHTQAQEVTLRASLSTLGSLRPVTVPVDSCRPIYGHRTPAQTYAAPTGTGWRRSPRNLTQNLILRNDLVTEKGHEPII